MKAIVQRRYGNPDVLTFEEVDPPAINDEQVLVRVHASSVNPADWHRMTGTPYLARMGGGWRQPKRIAIGSDVAGVVEKVGAKVTRWRPGDAVFGMCGGAFAEYAVVRENGVAAKPSGVTFEQAAAVPIAGLTALQALRDKGAVQAGQRVLINGASGGVGTFAVQIAKAYGAEVTGVCSPRNVEMVRSLGAEHILDYTREDFLQSGQKYDVMLDIAGGRSVAERKSVLRPGGMAVLIGGPKPNRWTGIPASQLITIFLTGRRGTRKTVVMLARNNKDDLATIAAWIEDGTVRPVIERTYPLPQTPEAMRYLGEGHARGKLVITV
jgi:NADPH:quinone reductase-like Zn-dependent oxidoreductase